MPVNEKRKVLVTGAASGIGAAICKKLANEQTVFLLHTRSNKKGLDEIAKFIESVGGQTEQKLSDLSLKGEGRLLVKEAIRRFGSLDIIIANAGYANKASISDLTDREFEEAHNTISRSFFELTTAAIPFLKKSNNGRIIGISAFGPHVWRTQVMPFAATAAAKGALEITAKALALKLAPYAITVNIIAPGFIRKDPNTHLAIDPKALEDVCAQIPMGRIGEAHEVASVVEFCSSKESSYLTGQVIHVNGGLV
jgi:NAD(P)-dependent dehydrogenase (short-subunit alcohol dehydrogenase family)